MLEIHNNCGSLQALSLKANIQLNYKEKQYHNIQSLLTHIMIEQMTKKKGLREISNIQYSTLRATLVEVLRKDNALLQLLLSTGDSYLTYRSLDNFVWGTTLRGVGSNKLGALWEDLRAEFTNATTN